MLFHIRCLQLVVSITWVVGIPPDTGSTIVTDTTSIGESICCRGVEDLAHEGECIVENGCSLQPG